MKKFVFATLVMMCSVPAFAATKTATCEIVSGDVSYKGKCVFVSERDGSFLVKKAKGNILPDVSSISVSIVETGVAEVRGLTTHGINSRWGEAFRSKVDRACWVGDDFEICAR